MRRAGPSLTGGRPVSVAGAPRVQIYGYSTSVGGKGIQNDARAVSFAASINAGGAHRPNISVYQESGERVGSQIPTPTWRKSAKVVRPTTMKEEHQWPTRILLICSRPSPSPRVIPTRCATRSPTPCSTPSSRRRSSLPGRATFPRSGQPADPTQVRCACETMATTGMIIVAGEIRTQAYVDVPALAREVLREIGYLIPRSTASTAIPAACSTPSTTKAPTSLRASMRATRPSTARRATILTRRSAPATRA